MSRHSAAPETSAIHGTHSRANAIVPECGIDVGEPAPTAMKRRPAVVKIIYRRIVDVDDVVSAAVAPVPRVVPVTRTARQPADMTETKSESDANTEAPASPPKERNISRRPDWIVSRINRHWPRPPRPTRAVGQPAAIVIRCPAPRLIRNPRPTEVWLPYPTAGTIRRPSGANVGNPHSPIIGNCGPTAVGVEVLRTGVVTIRVAVAVGVRECPGALAIS